MKVKNKKKVNNKNKKKKKIRLRFGRIFLTLFIIVLILFLIKTFFKFPIKNIYIEGNKYIKDQEIIDLANISDYPSYFKYTKKQLKKKLEKSYYIKKVVVKKKKLSEIYIKVEENTPLFYNTNSKKMILLDGQEIKEQLNGPILINYVPDKIYKKLKEQMGLVNIEIINRISEIKYDPNNVDDERFLLAMMDGNYVYITLDKLENINNYVKISLEIVNKFGDKKGILNLDAGEYFEIFD